MQNPKGINIPICSHALLQKIILLVCGFIRSIIKKGIANVSLYLIKS